MLELWPIGNISHPLCTPNLGTEFALIGLAWVGTTPCKEDAMNIPSISGGAGFGVNPASRTPQAAQKPAEPPVALLPSGHEMQNSIINSALQTMESLHSRFEDKTPMPRPSPTADLIKSALAQYAKANASAEAGASMSIVG